MYDFEIQHETTATPEELWAVYTDVAGWPRWNRAIGAAHLDGRFESGGGGWFNGAFSAVTSFHFQLESVEPSRRFDVVWGLKPLLTARLSHVIERTASGARFTHGFHAGGVGAVLDFGNAMAQRAHIPGTMALLAGIAEGKVVPA